MSNQTIQVNKFFHRGQWRIGLYFSYNTEVINRLKSIGAQCSSSDSLKAAFIHDAFTYWDVFASNIKMIDFTWMHDLDTAAVNYYANYYGLADTSFLEFLRTIGMRTWYGSGADKPALEALRCEALARGFNNLPLSCSVTAAENKVVAAARMQVYPNPSIGAFTVSLPLGGLLRIFDSKGALMRQEFVAAGEHTLDSAWPSGLYYAVFTGKDGSTHSEPICIKP